jgi:hypothetical protein
MTIYDPICTAYFCTNVYRPCSSTGSSIEVKRPCVGLCSSLWDTCGPTVAVFNMAVTNCLDDAVFDSSDDPLICNDLVSTRGMQLVADTSEVYVGEVCKGITTRTWNAPSVFPIAPLLPPFVQQAIFESLLVSIADKIPQILTSECLLSQRKLVCGL